MREMNTQDGAGVPASSLRAAVPQHPAGNGDAQPLRGSAPLSRCPWPASGTRRGGSFYLHPTQDEETREGNQEEGAEDGSGARRGRCGAGVGAGGSGDAQRSARFAPQNRSGKLWFLKIVAGKAAGKFLD